MSHEHPFRNPDLPLDQRIADLLSRLSVEEKVSQMLHEAPAIPHLGIHSFSWWNEALHGVARAGSATVFPQAIGLAACFDRDLTWRVATAISDEARAKYEVWLERNTSGRYCGLTFWTPNINIFRDPRWGRGQETYGEDPYLTGEIGLQFVRGLQGDSADGRPLGTHLKTSACAKHFAVHSGPEKDRHSFDAKASPYDLEDTYLPAFRKLVMEGRVESVMGAYNRTNGEPCCGSDFLLRRTLRGEWGFRGHVVSDCWAIKDFHEGHKVTSCAEESAALALKAGCDLNCGNLYHHLLDALVQGRITQADIDTSLGRLLSTRFRLGEFDPREQVAWRAVSREVVRSPAHVGLSLEAAARSMVLLKNDGILPLDKSKLMSLYLTGPNAIAAEALLGNYHGLAPRLVTFAEGITAVTGLEVKTEFRHGCLLAEKKKIDADWATFESKEFDATIVFLGLGILLEGEEGDAIAAADYGDRPDIGLPKGQHDYLMGLLATGKPIILVVSAGSPVDLSPYVDKAAAVVWTWYPGEQGGTALAELLFGRRDFSGRLPITFPRSLADLPAFEDYGMAGRTYRYMEAEPLYPFGYGLGYRRLAVESVGCPAAAAKAGESLELTVALRNPHDRPAADVLQVYLRKEVPGQRSPRYELAGFQRVELPTGVRAELRVRLAPEQLAVVQADGKRCHHPGKLTVWAGLGQPDARSRALGLPEPARLELPLA
jgi:beta-glucosidase